MNYGSRAEILEAARARSTWRLRRSRRASSPNRSRKPHLKAASIPLIFPDPDLLIRTSGEMRISNFLLWQIAYTEFYFTDVLWPDFDRYEFLRALLYYQHRDRRFGAV